MRAFPDKPAHHGRDHRPGGEDPIKAGVWHNIGDTGEPAFQNSWANSGGSDEVLRFGLVVGPPSKSGDTLDDSQARLEIQGAITGGSYGTVVFTLPDGYRPANTLYLAGSDSDNNPITWKVESTGDVSVYAGSVPDGTITGAKLEDSGVAAGSYGDAAHVPQITVDAKGRITTASDIAIAGAPTELLFVPLTAAITVTASSEATAQSVVSAGAYTYDGSTKVRIEFFVPSAVVGASANLFFELFDGSTPLGWLIVISGTGSANTNYPIFAAREITPSSGSHTYQVKAYKTAGSGQIIQAGSGGSGAYLPGYIRVVTVT